MSGLVLGTAWIDVDKITCLEDGKISSLYDGTHTDKVFVQFFGGASLVLYDENAVKIREAVGWYKE